MSAIKAGDMVQLVWACCTVMRRAIGWTGVVEATDNGQKTVCNGCGYVTLGPHAWVHVFPNDPEWSFFPIPWLIKVEPPSLTETQTELEELAA